LFRKNGEYGGDYPVVWVKELFEGHTIDLSHSKQINPTSSEMSRYGLKKGDILFCRSSLKLEGVGYNNIFDGDDDNALFECHIIRISPHPSKVNSYYLNYLLRTPGMRRKTINRAKTVTMSTISQENILELEVCLPPLNIQNHF